MPSAPSDLPCQTAQRERRRYLFDMLEQLATMAVSCDEKEVADVLYALVAVYGNAHCARTAGGGYSTASN